MYVGEPKANRHPLTHQENWLVFQRGGSIPRETLDLFEKLHKIALESNVSLEGLFYHTFTEEREKEELLASLRQSESPTVISLPGNQGVDIVENHSPSAQPLPTLDHPIHELAVGLEFREVFQNFREFGRYFFPGSRRNAVDNQLILFSILVYLCMVYRTRPTNMASLYDQFNESFDDFSYSLSVILDTNGRKLPVFVYDLLALSLQEPVRLAQSQESILERLKQFAVEKLPKTTNLPLSDWQKSLRSHLSSLKVEQVS